MTDITLTPALQAIRDAQQAIADAQKAAASGMKDAISQALASTFEKYPFLGSVAWSQYTPHFNDGDTCTFSCHIEEASCNSLVDVAECSSNYAYEDGEDFGKRTEEENYGGYDYMTRSYGPTTPNEDFDQAYLDCRSEVHAILSALRPKETTRAKYGELGYDDPSPFDLIMLSAFGDHVQVTVTREGIEVDHHDHD